MAVIGIDLGTTNSLCCVWYGGKCVLIPNSLGEYLTPSVVSIDDNGELLTGKAAGVRRITRPDHTAAGFKLFMGTDQVFALGSKKLRPEELSSLILRRLKEDAEAFLKEPVTEAVISVPAYFNNNQRAATKLAGELAGLHVERIVNEPSAAAMTYYHSTGQNGTYLVVDLGGGTLDISVVEVFDNIIDILAVAGDNHLGGIDVDTAIAEAFFDKHPGLKDLLSASELASVTMLAEQCKMNLTVRDQAMMVFVRGDEAFELFLTNHMLSELVAPLLQKLKAVMKHALRDAGRSVAVLDEVVLVGGSGKMPILRRYIQQLTGKEPRCSVDPDTAIAFGVGLVTGIKAREETVRDLIMTDICPFTLGTRVFNRETKNQNEFSPIIERNSPLPVSRERRYSPVRDYQETLVIDIYQGESPSVLGNVWLGQLELSLPKATASEVSVGLRYTYDLNGILEVEATCNLTGQTKTKLILENTSLSDTELAARRQFLSQLKIAPRERDENRYLLERGASLFALTTGRVREAIYGATSHFETILERGHPAEIERARSYLTQFLDAHEDNDEVFYTGEDK